MSQTHRTLVSALFSLAKHDVHATVLRLVAESGLCRSAVVAALGELDRAGLVDAERVRLTMHGLVAGASLGSVRRTRGSRQVAA